MQETENYLNLSAWEQRSVVNGPGERFVLWIQGCPIGCQGCFNPETHADVQRHLVTVDELAEMIFAVPSIEGVTYTGGEPMTQAEGLALLSERLRAAGLTIVSYTGYTLGWLRAQNDPWIERLLACVDLLIDGPYVQEKAANLLWRGSTNQRVHFLTDAYRHLAQQVDQRPAEVEFIIKTDRFTTTGTWPKGFVDRLKEILRS